MSKFKAGDLAYIATTGGCVGLWREACQQAIGIPRTLKCRRPNVAHPDKLVWEFDTPIHIVVQGRSVELTAAGESVLRPLRDQPGQDEMLRITGLPTVTEGIAHG